uniref:Uncharacterized protein n=1 Tax=Arundo donax TaxID=35708 RepID=A0A0A9E1W9_ARUDO
MPGRARFFLAGGPGGGSCAPPEDDTAVVGVASTSMPKSRFCRKVRGWESATTTRVQEAKLPQA